MANPCPDCARAHWSTNYEYSPTNPTEAFPSSNQKCFTLKDPGTRMRSCSAFGSRCCLGQTRPKKQREGMEWNELVLSAKEKIWLPIGALITLPHDNLWGTHHIIIPRLWECSTDVPTREWQTTVGNRTYGGIIIGLVETIWIASYGCHVFLPEMGRQEEKKARWQCYSPGIAAHERLESQRCSNALVCKSTIDSVITTNVQEQRPRCNHNGSAWIEDF